MSFLNLLYKKIHSKFEDIISPDLDSANDTVSDYPLAESSAVDGCSDQQAIDVSSEPTAPLFRPQVLDNGRTLLLGITGNKKVIVKNPQSTSTPPSGSIPITGVTTSKQANLSVDEIAALLDTPEEEEKDAAIVYKLKCSKCDVNGKIDSFTETFACPLCGGTMHLIEVYANHSQHSPEEIKQQLSVLYSKYQRGDLQARRTWTLLISQSHFDSKLEEYMRQYIKPYSVAAEKFSNSSPAIVSRTNSETKIISRAEIVASINSEAQNKSSNSTWPSRIQLSPAAFRAGEQKMTQFTPEARPVNRTVAKPYLLIPELERTYKTVNESNGVKSLFSNNDQSLLRGLGYKVGKSSKLTAADRRKMLVKAFVADTSTINSKWNKPMTQERVTALISLLRRLNDSDFYKMNDYSVAIKHRKEDIAWLSNYTEFVKDAIIISRTFAIY